MKGKAKLDWKLLSVMSVLCVAFLGGSMTFAAHHEDQNEQKIKASKVKEEAMETYDALKNYTLAQRNEAIAAADKKIESLDAKLDAIQKDLDERWQSMNEATREKMRETIQKFKKEREDVAEWYGGMRHSSADAWEEVKKGFADSYDRLEKTYQDVKEDFDGRK